MAAVRLRKAFRYPEESESEREELDEEEQERVIEQLQIQNDARNAQYSMIFTALPLLAATPCLVVDDGLYHEMLPLQPDRKGKKPVTFHTERIARIHAALVPGTSAVCLLLGLVYLSTGSSYGIRPVLYLIPGIMLAVILLAQKVMLSVDLASLKDLQYEYKGA
ncbi:hypothetical protein N7447_010437 [Penicillium robsamsonii]|uniref:uncharacterized protein n=1 Tax=Penicillium robsamsonii TaxID=1792511 RepID=UPI0025491F57|nr:uncharacterized protein N7447_010437 [Penicillium robsamsonii]KAJ5810921.1 hypothetical protein N7447_010437 [Penicillium robsamsonii]